MKLFVDLLSINRYCKQEQTQHVWCFRSVENSMLFPTGVQTTYRAYSADQVVLFQKKNKSQCVSPIGKLIGLEPYCMPVPWYPAENTYPERNVEGFYILQKLPELDDEFNFKPKEFYKGSYEVFQEAIKNVCTVFKHDKTVVQAWNKWNELFLPQCDNAEEYLRKYPERYKQPLLNLIKEAKHIDISQLRLQKTFNHEKSENTFIWPEATVLPMPSVGSKFNKNPPDPRFVDSKF